MTRKRSTHKSITVRPPAGLRPKLTGERLRELGLVHICLVDSLVDGTADLNVLWEWMAAVLTWSRVAQECRLGEAEINVVGQLAVALGQRYEETGQVRLNEEEIELVRQGSVVMDLLAQAVDLQTAQTVARWSEERIGQLRSPPAAAA